MRFSSPFSRLWEKLKRLAAGPRRGRGGRGANGVGQGADLTGSLPQQGPHVAAKDTHDQGRGKAKGKGTKVDGGRVDVDGQRTAQMEPSPQSDLGIKGLNPPISHGEESVEWRCFGLGP